MSLRDFARLFIADEEEPEGSGDDKLDGISDSNSEPDFAAGAVTSALSLEAVISVAEQAMERAGQAGARITVPVGHQDFPEYQAAIAPLTAQVRSWGKAVGLDPSTIRIYSSSYSLGGALAMVSETGAIVTQEHTNEMTILHEIAHLVNQSHEGTGHNAAFARTARDLYGRFISPAAAETFWNLVGPSVDGRTAANSDELATEPMGYDDNDMDDMDTGTTGPTIQQTDIDPDNAVTAAGITFNQPATHSWDAWRGFPLDVSATLATKAYHGQLTVGDILGGADPDLGSWWSEDRELAESYAGSSYDSYQSDELDDEHTISVLLHATLGPESLIQDSESAYSGHYFELDPGTPIHLIEVFYMAGDHYDWVRVPANRSVTAAIIKEERKLRIVASWVDVQAKAKRIKDDGGVRVIAVTGPYVTAHVQGDDGVYETTLQRGSTGSIDQWTCSCPWFAYSFGRSGRWKKYEGRMCSHALALQYQAQSEGMFGKDIKEQQAAPQWDNGKIDYYEAPAPKEWRASVAPTPATRVATRLFGGKPDQPRADDGKWTDGMGDKPDKGYGKITPGEARGDSKQVTPQEFDALAERGKEHYERLLADKRPTTAFDDDDKWATIRSGAFDAAQKSWGGQTIDPETGRAIERSTGYSLEVRAPGEKQLSVPEDADEATFNAMMDKAREEYADKLEGSEVYLGVFRDDDNNRIDFDPVTIVVTTAEVDALGAYTHAVGGAYDFSTGNGHFPPHVASLSSEIKQAINIWSTIKVNNQKALPNPEHDGFRYAFHQVMGDSTGFRYEPSDPEFIRGENMATTFLNAFIENQTSGSKPYYRAIGLHPAAYHDILESAQTGDLDLPPASWSADKKLTEQFGLTYEQGTKSYEKRIIFVTKPGASSWALGRMSNTGYEREHIVGGRFHVSDIRFPNDGDNTTIITLAEVQGWPDDFAATGDLIDHMAFDSELASPQDSKTAAHSCDKTARYLTRDEALAGEIDYSLDVESADHVDSHKGLMIAVRPPQSVCDELALDQDGAEENAQLHVTLAYIGPEESDGLDLDALRQVVIAEAALATPPFGSLTGYGRFDTPDGEVVVCLVDSEELQVARHHLVKALERAGIEISHAHGFTPHISLIYKDGYDFGSLERVDKQPFQFSEFIISPPSGVWETYPIGGTIAVKASDIGTSPVGDSQADPLPPTSDPEAQWPDSEQEEQRPHEASFFLYADDEGAPLPSDAEMDTEDPTGSPADSMGETSALPGAQADLHDEPEPALPATDGTSSEPDETYETDEQNNTHLYGEDDGAADTTIRGGGDTTVVSRAWLDPSNSTKGVKDVDTMDISKAAKDYLMTSTAVKTFTYAEQQEIINEGEGVTASNLDRLSLEGTHYEKLEEQLARAEAVGEPVLWWN
jgi:2'-5' RNA ligase